MTREQADKIALGWQVLTGRQRLLIDVAKADEAFKLAPLNEYLGNGESDTAKGYDARIRFEEFAAAHNPEEITAPTVMFGIIGDVPHMRFLDGRHRYCVLRDAGVKQMIVGGRYPAISVARTYGILIEDNKETNNA